jgi:uncharacterized protein
LIAYVDASAGVKLFLDERESSALTQHLDELGEHDLVVSATLLETELRRAAQREDVDQSVVSRALEAFELITMPRGLFTTAGLLPWPTLRSLDALHLATAVRADCDVVLTYDHRMQVAAQQAGLEVLAPS